VNSLRRKLLLTLLCLTSALRWAAAGSAEPQTSPPGDCDAPPGMEVLCGPVHPEDLVQIPDTPWIIASNFRMAGGTGQPGELYLIDSVHRSWTTLLSSASVRPSTDPAFADCLPLPDPLGIGSHGLALQRRRDGVQRLWVVNHVGRESVEAFNVESVGGSPKLVWIGCVVMPTHTLGNGIAATADDGFVITSMFDRTDPRRWEKVAAGEVTGAVYVWHPRGGFHTVQNSAASGNNGIVVAPDGTLFVAAWSGKAIVRLRKAGGQMVRDELALDFLPDNLHWAPDGTLLVAGQRRDLHKMFVQCDPQPCAIAWVLGRIDPKTMKYTTLAEGDGHHFSDATAIVQVGQYFWVGSASAHAIALLPTEKSRR